MTVQLLQYLQHYLRITLTELTIALGIEVEMIVGTRQTF